MCFATRPARAARVIGRTPDAGILVSRVADDEIHGSDPHLRPALERRRLGHVLAVACDHRITTRAGRIRAGALARTIPERARRKLSAGATAPARREGRGS
ncbi:hypothetical protein ACFXAE_25400 [Streptomyces sp. NPDC059454]|uniref:hypothetical protein n=1 Tax=Streptomyces sp. NPDC059454 TaxID=3346836 RepID=UPI0036BA4DB3